MARLRFQHSYSSINTFQQCPRKFEEVYINKNRQPTSPAMQEGQEVHSQLEAYIKGRSAVLPDRMPDKEFVDRLIHSGGKAEVSIAVDKEGNQVKFFDNTAYLRGKIDVMVQGKNKVLAIDWKTGRKKIDDLQAKVYTSMIYRAYNKPVAMVFHFLDKGPLPTVKLDSQQADAEVMNLLSTIDKARKFPPKPGPLCRFCHVKSCEYWGE